MNRPKLVVSAVSLVEGGTLSILLDLAAHLDATFAKDDVLYLIHGSIADHFSGRHFEAYTWPKRSWLRRLYFEKVYARRIEQRLQPKLWLSMHDVTARLCKTPQFLYCHNPSPFFDWSTRLPVFDLKFFLFSRLYHHLYRWDIHKNEQIIVQQEWLRREFVQRYGLCPQRVLVARPIVRAPNLRADATLTLRRPTGDQPFIFLYPTLPRVFKNIEFLAKLAHELAQEPIEFWITINGRENRYAKFLEKRYGRTKTFRLIGRQPREKLFELYRQVDCLIFPSRLETWGLPLSEFMETGKPILAADLPYAREVLQNYPMANLISIDNVGATADTIRSLLSGRFLASSVQSTSSDRECPNWFAFAQWIAQAVK